MSNDKYYQIALKLLDIEQQTMNYYTLITESREHKVYKITFVPAYNIIETGIPLKQKYVGFYPDSYGWGIYLNECFIASFEFYDKIDVLWYNFMVLKLLGSKTNEYNKNNT